MNGYFCVLTTIDFFVLCFMCILTYLSETLSKKQKRGFFLAFVLIAGISVLEVITLVVDGLPPGYRWLNITANYLGFGLSPAVCICLVYVLDRKTALRREIRTAVRIEIGYLIFLFVTIPCGMVFSVSADNIYSRGYDKKTGRSSRSMMEDTLRICHHFIDSFGTEFNNLFFYGDVGVGKTFLSTCIAKEIMNREYSVLYFSAPQLFNTLAKNAFDKNDIDAHNMCEYIFDCDLLIIDDLGTEYTNAFIASQFFTCINERLLHRKSTIISTNLSLESLADLYTERSFSRITSRYSLLKIVGDDIRIKKKLEH